MPCDAEKELRDGVEQSTEYQQCVNEINLEYNNIFGNVRLFKNFNFQ